MHNLGAGDSLEEGLYLHSLWEFCCIAKVQDPSEYPKNDFYITSLTPPLPSLRKFNSWQLNFLREGKKMIFQNAFLYHQEKLFSSQPFFKPFSNMVAFIAKSLCKRYYVFLCLSLFLFASKLFTAVTEYQGSLFLFYISGFLGALWGLVFVCICL